MCFTVSDKSRGGGSIIEVHSVVAEISTSSVYGLCCSLREKRHCDSCTLSHHQVILDFGLLVFKKEGEWANGSRSVHLLDLLYYEWVNKTLFTSTDLVECLSVELRASPASLHQIYTHKTPTSALLCACVATGWLSDEKITSC